MSIVDKDIAKLRKQIETGIVRESCTTKAGNTLSFFYNPNNDLLVVDLIHKNEKAGNEIVRKTLDEKKLLNHAESSDKPGYVRKGKKGSRNHNV